MDLQQEMFDLVEQQDKAGIPIADFCQAYGISYGKFHYWRKKWKIDGSMNDDIVLSAPSGFVQLQPVSPSTASCLHLAHGIQLHGSVDELARFYHQLQMLRDA